VKYQLTPAARVEGVEEELAVHADVERLFGVHGVGDAREVAVASTARSYGTP
jgi:hypothetical protein